MKSATRNPTAPRAANAAKSELAFTLVELLVVVTIIVILLTMLSPALSKAMYQAQLAACAGGNLKSMTTGVIAYAWANKRYYPDRGIGPRTAKDANPLPINPYTLKRGSVNYDARPILRTLFPINKTMQCPLSPTVELDNDNDPTAATDVLSASYNMFWGWQYKEDGTDVKEPLDGSFMLGQPFEYDSHLMPGRDGIMQFNVLAGDVDLCWNTGHVASHPDFKPSLMYSFSVQGQFFIDGPTTAGFWAASNFHRGLIDTNYAFDDGSVNRYNDVVEVSKNGEKERDPRMAIVRINFNAYNHRGDNVDNMHIPLR